MRGALTIYRPQHITEAAACSAGFIGQGAINPQNFWVITAGHCGQRAGDTWFHGGDFTGVTTPPFNGYKVGTQETATGTFHNGSDTDALLLPLLAGDRSSDIYINSENIRRMHYQQIYDTDYIGEAVCNSGGGSYFYTGLGSHCGYLNAKLNVYVSGTYLIDQREANLFSCKGDSGGPIFKYDTALGILSAITPNRNSGNCGSESVYSQIGHVARAVHVNVNGTTLVSGGP